jgi:HEAT repeats
MHDPDGDVRSRAADRLRSNGSKEAIGVFVEAIRNGSDEVRRLAAGRMLGGQEAAAALLPLLDDKNPAVRAAALGALGDHERREYIPLEKVVRLLDDSDIEISKAAALALQEWGHRGPVSARQIGSLRLVTDRHGSRTEYDRDPPAEPPAPAWRVPEVQSTSSAAGSVDSGGGGTAARSMLTVLTLVLLGTFGVLAVVRRAGLSANDGRPDAG